ncbi:MAG: NblA/ycf18 family protein [Cyanobacteria bacterium J06627_3]
MEMPVELSLEQEFELRLLKEQVKQLSLNQAQDYVVEMMRQMMLKENLFKHLMKQS